MSLFVPIWDVRRHMADMLILADTRFPSFLLPINVNHHLPLRYLSCLTDSVFYLNSLCLHAYKPRCVYTAGFISVVLLCACPSNSCIYRKSTPLSRRCVAKLWRSVYEESLLTVITPLLLPHRFRKVLG